jgi:hypothetical protein
LKLDADTLVPPLAAAVILALILTQTREALNLSGAWQRASAAAARATSPFAALEGRIAETPPELGAIPRDPMRAHAEQVAQVVPRTRQTRPQPPPPPPKPVLTSIIFDADPRATVRWGGRDYSVRAGALFADFRVVSIAREQVVLERQGEPLVLRLPKRGDNE